VLNRIHRAEEIWPGDLSITSRADGYIIDRALFLRDIIQEFIDHGGMVCNGSVRTVLRKGERFALGLRSGETLSCSYLVGADGACSRVRKNLFGEEPPLMVPARQYLLDREMPGDVIRFHYGSRYGGGYKWEFPFGGMTKVGFPAGTDDLGEEAVESHARMIPAGGLSRVVQGNACLVGDAAAQANPLTFGGIRVAMVAGKMAARAICDGDIGTYERWWRSSTFSSPIFLRVYRRLVGMSEEELRNSVLPFQRGYGPLSYAKAYLTRPGFRDMYRAYRLTNEYGW
jgi:flavin-dependent dehydrogenase